MKLNTQAVLEDDLVKLQPLQAQDFETLYHIACDPEIWKQHPNKNRYERDVFKNFFEGAIISEGAYLIIDKTDGKPAGSTRFYGYDEDENSIFIGYTFYGVEFWGKGLNTHAKTLMLNHIFQYVDLVKFHVGKDNQRSRRAMEKLGAEFKGEIVVAYHGEPDRENVEYWIRKEDWLKK